MWPLFPCDEKEECDIISSKLFLNYEIAKY